MPGRISVSFRREPSFIDAAVVEGPFRQTIVARDSSDQRIVAVASRSIRDRFVNGQPAPVGYLSGLRILPSHRNATILARGYRFLRELHTDARTPLYETTIVESNRHAVSMLTSGRAGLPQYRPAGSYHTLSIPVARHLRRDASTARDLELRPATATDTDAIVEFLLQTGSCRQFFPRYAADDFFCDGGTFRALQPSDILLAFRDGRLVGTLGAWNQSSFRQTVIERYGGPLKWFRPLYNVREKILGRPELPAPGGRFRCAMAAIPLVEGNDPDVFGELLRILPNAATVGQCDYILLRLHETDPLLPIARPFSITSFVTQLYHVYWNDGDTASNRLDDRVPYLELGSL